MWNDYVNIMRFPLQENLSQHDMNGIQNLPVSKVNKLDFIQKIYFDSLLQ